MIHFKISEFVIDREAQSIPLHVADKILKYHIPIINPIREEKGSSIYVSDHSGFRSLQWELDHGRPGTSQHTFGDGQENPSEWWGAVDYTCDDLPWLFEKLKASAYKRVCLYDTFIHCDHKGTEKLTFKSVDGVWIPFNKVSK